MAQNLHASINFSS